MKPEPSLTVISLGGGVQSSVMALMANEGAVRPHPRLRHIRRHPLGAAQHLRAPGVAERPAELPPVRRGQRTQPPRGCEGPHQPLGLPKLRGHTRLPEGRRRGGRRHRQAAVHRQLQDQAHQTQDKGIAGPETPAARPRRNHRRAVARHLHRRGHTHEDLPRPVDDEPLPSHRGGDVPQRLPELVEEALRQAPGTLGLRRLPLPVPAAVGGDQAQVAGAVRRGGGDRRPACGRGWPWTRRRTCTPCGCRWPRRSPAMRWTWERTGCETGSETSARDIVGCEVGVKSNDRGLGNPQLHGLSPASSVDSRRRSWYFSSTTPIASPVGSRPSSGAVSVFVWE